MIGVGCVGGIGEFVGEQQVFDLLYGNKVWGVAFYQVSLGMEGI